MNLKELQIHQRAVIQSVGGNSEESLRQHLLDMGIIPGAEVEMIRLAPMGDPLEIRIHDYELTLRLADAETDNVLHDNRRLEVHPRPQKVRVQTADICLYHADTVLPPVV